ncbi:hypothetical protein SVXHx_2517 [Haloferax volcanii]|nr:hypothetical protein SVXHx_2517 [Haloferax lucentense]
MFISTVLWIFYSIFKTRGDPRPVISAMRELWLEWDTILDQRQPLDVESMSYLQENHGRLLF